MTTKAEREFIEKMRGLLADASTDVRERIDGSDHWLEGRLVPSLPHTPIALFDIGADYRDVAFYVNAHRAVSLLLRIYDDAVAHFHRMNPRPDAENPPAEQRDARPYSPAQNCGTYCTKPMFQRYMHEVHGLDHPHDAQRMRTKIHSLLAIKSRADLDTDTAATARWHDLRASYKAWRETKL